MTVTDPKSIRARLGEAMLYDAGRIRVRLRGLERAASGGRRSTRKGSSPNPPKDPQAVIERIERDLERSIALRAERAARVPKVTYPEDLPVSGKRDEIAAAIRDHQVVIVCGETGSGKTTQLPKICLDAAIGLGRGVAGMIGHTQPRRIAARSVAARVADELGVQLGGAVGAKVRFTDQTSEHTFIKLLTDGMLLAETQSDRRLQRYDTIIVDEAHERSLNIDFLLGYLRRLLPQRPDLKVIITSATIDPERFAEHFDTGNGPTPIIEVSGRTYPVDVRYRPAEAGDDELVYDRVVGALNELWTEARGDALVFMPGEREIRRTARELREHYGEGRGVEVLPLYARLSHEEQQRVFRPHSGLRVVIATNVAETSLTVPGIRYVIDPGTARISRFSARSKMQGLPIEPISRASADQRAGRCGRVGPGVCVRLYEQSDFEKRERFTPPEILRTNLASVILQMHALKLGEPEEFPFVEPPPASLIRAGYETLHELGAVDDEHRLTPLGESLAKLPTDPRIGRMILAAHDENVLAEVLIIASALSVPDPRDRPAERQAEADEQHARFADPASDFLAYLNLWTHHHHLRGKLGRSRLTKALRAQFLSPLRLYEWGETYRQLRSICRDQGWEPGHLGELDDTRRDAIHRSLLTGLLANVGRKTGESDYAGTRGSRFHLFPGSALFEAKPGWVMAAEIVRTSRVYARCVARVRPEWIERLGAHLVQASHTRPRFEERSGRVVADERVTMLGLEIVPRRSVDYGKIDQRKARELFIFEGIVEVVRVVNGVSTSRPSRPIANWNARSNHSKRRRAGATCSPSARRCLASTTSTCRLMCTAVNDSNAGSTARADATAACCA